MSTNPPYPVKHEVLMQTFPSFPEHEFWTSSRIEKFCNAATPLEFREGAFILSPDDPPNALFLIETGRVSMYYYSNEGSVITYSHAGPGELLGTKGVFIKPERLFYTIADCDVRVWKISHKAFLTLLQEDFEFVCWHFSRAFSRLDNLERKMLNSALLSSHRRLALTLLELSDRAENRTENTAQIAITQQELSNMLSVTRQTIGTCIKDFQDKGILQTKRGKIEIFDLKALKAEMM